MTDHGEREPYSIADLAADAADVRRVLDLDGATPELPRLPSVVLASDAIPEGALALVAGLDSYGD